MAEQGEQSSKGELDQPLTIEQRFMQKFNPDLSDKDKQSEDGAPQNEEKPTEGSGDGEALDEKPEEGDRNKDEADAAARKVETVDQASLDNTFYEVDTVGGTSEVSITDLIGSFKQQADYTQKTTALADERKQFDSAFSEARETILNARQGVIDTETYLIQGDMRELRQLQATDWQTLKSQDPDAFMLRRIELQDAQEAVRGKADRVESFKQELAQARETERTQRVDLATQEAKVLMPELAGPEASSFAQALVDYAVTQGIPEVEAEGVESAQYLLILNKARLWDESQVKTGEAKEKLEVVKVRRVIKAGGAPASPENAKDRDVQARRARLKETGKQRDLAAVFLDQMNARGSQ